MNDKVVQQMRARPESCFAHEFLTRHVFMIEYDS